MPLFFRSLLIAILTIPLGIGAMAQPHYPEAPVKIVVPVSPGGVPDTLARLLAQKLQDRIKQSVVVENRAGAGGSLAVGAIRSAPADGATLMLIDSMLLTVSSLLTANLPYDSAKHLVPLAALTSSPLFLAVNSQVPVNTLREFLDYVKANPGVLNFGSTGIGSMHHLTMEAVKGALKLDMVHVPYRGGGQSVAALLGNQVQVIWAAYPSIKGGVEAGTIKILAHSGPGRSQLVPDAPPLADVMPGFEMAAIVGLFGHHDTPNSVVQKIASDSIAIVKDPEFVARLAPLGMELVGQGPEVFSDLIRKERDRTVKLVEGAGLKPQ